MTIKHIDSVTTVLLDCPGVIQAKLVSLEEPVSKANKTCRCGSLKLSRFYGPEIC